MSACKLKKNKGTGKLCMHPKEMSVRELKAVKAYTSGTASSKRSALRVAGYKEGYVTNGGSSKFFRRPRVRQYMLELFESQGISEGMLATKMKDLLSATRLQSIAFKVHEVPDNATQARVLELAAKCLGWLEENVNTVGIGIFEGDEAAEVLSQARGLVARYDQALAASGGEGGAAAVEHVISPVAGETARSVQEQKPAGKKAS